MSRSDADVAIGHDEDVVTGAAHHLLQAEDFAVWAGRFAGYDQLRGDVADNFAISLRAICAPESPSRLTASKSSNSG